ncbi:hypothetical protein QCM77_42795 [Bradyrhizobium sp. SSUT18]|nr:hypothetical protein [Bradyrhizobium sp. SSUT18]MDH2406546.1 hypothetical protein [Bradyrhizobium sp. SSUT18]
MHSKHGYARRFTLYNVLTRTRINEAGKLRPNWRRRSMQMAT